MPAAVIGQVLREARRRQGLTQEQLAPPFSTAFVCSVELGNTMPSLPSLAILLERLGMSMSEFFFELECRTDQFDQAVDG